MVSEQQNRSKMQALKAKLKEQEELIQRLLVDLKGKHAEDASGGGTEGSGEGPEEVEKEAERLEEGNEKKKMPVSLP